MILNNTKNALPEASITISIQQFSPAPAPAVVALLHPMPEDRMLAFRTNVANRVRAGLAAGQQDAAVITQIANEQVAIAKAIANPHFTPAMAKAYGETMRALGTTISEADAVREVGSILRNRIEDCKGFVTLLSQPAFIAAVRAEAAQPAAAAKLYMLPPHKVEETIRRMVQPDDPAGAEPAVHVAASARGHQVTHQALAMIFEPQAGSLRAPLVQALVTAWPAANAGDIDTLATNWLKARYEPARAIAEGLREGGAMYQEALRRSEAMQQQKLSPGTAVPAPAPIITTPPVHAGMVRPSPDLVMEV
ncbi:MAG: hypothetical protein ACOYNL_10050 [Rickettsiales bacterium]